MLDIFYNKMLAQFHYQCMFLLTQLCIQLLLFYLDTHTHIHCGCESALNKYGCLHPDLPEKQSRLFKQQPVKASIEFYSEARFPLNGPLRLSDNS